MFQFISRFQKSLSHARAGLWYTIKNERNFQIELVCALFIMALIFIFDVRTWEAIILILMVLWVLIAELANTVLERIVDILKPRIHPYARLVKDIMAGIVLLSSIGAVIIGTIIFYPYLAEIYRTYF